MTSPSIDGRMLTLPLGKLFIGKFGVGRLRPEKQECRKTVVAAKILAISNARKSQTGTRRDLKLGGNPSGNT